MLPSLVKDPDALKNVPTPHPSSNSGCGAVQKRDVLAVVDATAEVIQEEMVEVIRLV